MPTFSKKKWSIAKFKPKINSVDCNFAPLSEPYFQGMYYMPPSKLQELKSKLSSFLRFCKVPFQALLAFPTLLALMEIFIFGWTPDMGFVSPIFRPVINCDSSGQPTHQGSNYLYHRTIKLSPPLVQKFPFAPKRNYRISFDGNGKSYFNGVTERPETFAESAFSYERMNSLKTSMIFNYRFVKNDPIEFTLQLVHESLLEENECGIRYHASSY